MATNLLPGSSPLDAGMQRSHIPRMTRRGMTYRVVALGSTEASSSRLGTTAGERLEMLAELSRLAWRASGRAFPQYERSNMPVRLTTLRDQGGPDDA